MSADGPDARGRGVSFIECRRRRLLIGACAAATLVSGRRTLAADAPTGLPPPSVAGRTLRVGPDQDIKSLAAAAKQARDGDTVVVNAGEYRGDVAVWNQSGLLIRSEGGRAVLRADGMSAEGKAIFVVRGRDVRMQGLEFTGARVRDRNGAGIRLEQKGQLFIEQCRFHDNENGILTGNDPDAELQIVDSEFTDNGAGDGQSHNLYVGAIARLTVTGSYFARARVGHLLKTRARESTIAYSRLSGEDGTGSYELEFPAGGRATVIGCVIQQGPESQNATIVSCGAEGYRWEANELVMSFCTIVNDRAGRATLLRAAAGNVTVEMVHNLLVGRGFMDVPPGARMRNTDARPGDFADPQHFDYRLRRGARVAGSLGMAGSLGVDDRLPTREYLHPASSVELELKSALTPLSPGAFQRLAP